MVVVPAEQLHQLGVNEELLFAEGHFAQNAQLHQLFQVARGGLPVGDAFVHDVADAAIGLLEDHVHQFAGIDFGQAAAHMVGGVLGQCADGSDFVGGPAGGFFDGAQHVQHPGFPSLVACDFQQQAVVIRLVGDDVPAQVEDGQMQQLFLNQVEDVDHPAGAAVAVGEGVDGLELVVAHGHADEWVQLRLVVKEPLPVGQQVTQAGFTIGWGVDDFARAVIGELGTGRPTNVHVCTLQGAADVHGGGGAEGFGLEGVKALVQGRSVPKCLFGGVVGLAIALYMLKKLVGGGDDVFDFRAVLGFEQRNGVDEHRLVGDQLRGLFELGQCGSRGNAGPQYRLALQFVGGRQGWQVVVWRVWGPQGGDGLIHVQIILIFRHV